MPAGADINRGSQQATESVSVDTGVAQDPGEGAALQLSVQEDDQRHGTLRVAQTHVATPLTGHDPTELAQRGDQLVAGDNWEAPAQAGSGSVRRTTPMSRARPSSRRPST